MKLFRERVTAYRPQILSIAARHGARDVRLFGSVVRGDDSVESDLDLLVTLERGRTLFDLARLEEDLEALLGRPVDVATDGELADDVIARVQAEARAL